jgi:hypothetical protein
MPKDPAPRRTARIIVCCASGFAIAAALALLATGSETKTPTATTEPATVIATSCRGFATDARQLFDKNRNAILKGNFAPGDHVHLAIDLDGPGYSWAMTGVSGEGAKVTPDFWSSILLRTTNWRSDTTITSTQATPTTRESSSTDQDGEINGYARWEVEFDVAPAHDGTLTITPTGSAHTPPRIAVASCTPAPLTTGSTEADRGLHGGV